VLIFKGQVKMFFWQKAGIQMNFPVKQLHGKQLKI
jgi:hypothetical protein